VATKPTTLMTANEAASVTGVSLRQVHGIIDAGLLGAAVKRRNKARLLGCLPSRLIVSAIASHQRTAADASTRPVKAALQSV
jgi:hypothetical protein